MYYKKFSNKEMQVIRQAIEKHGQSLSFMSEDYKIDEAKKELKAVEKLQKKLVHCYYLDRKGGANS